jgi:lysozyme
MASSELVASIKAHEGFRSKAYQDSVGVWTIGYGQNLQVLEIDRDTAERWLIREIEKAENFAAGLPEWKDLDQVRRDVVVEMVYNLGPRGYSYFVNTRQAIRDGNYEDAARRMLMSKWAVQVGPRAKRLAEQMRTGVRWNKET